jgi:hypothetical protein
MSPNRWILVALLAFAAPWLSPDAVHAKGDASGSLGSGGRVRGDISKNAGETDRVTVVLDEGAVLSLRFSANFEPRIVVTDPDGMPVEVGVPAHRRLRVHDRPLTASGTYEVSVSSVEGSQGTYLLAVSERWLRKVPVSGTGASVVDVAMPAGGTIGCMVRGASGAPAILGLEDPSNANLLPATIEPNGAVTRLGATATPAAGVYHLLIGAAGDGAWSGQVTRAVPRVRLGHLVLTNGLDAISFADDGVRSLFQNRCAPCHSWASSYAGVRSYVYSALGRMRSGSMPPTGRVGNADLALVQEWIKTGRQP